MTWRRRHTSAPRGAARRGGSALRRLLCPGSLVWRGRVGNRMDLCCAASHALDARRCRRTTAAHCAVLSLYLCGRSILQHRCAYLAALFARHPDEATLHISDFSRAVFVQLLEFLYTGALSRVLPRAAPLRGASAASRAWWAVMLGGAPASC